MIPNEGVRSLEELLVQARLRRDRQVQRVDLARRSLATLDEEILGVEIALGRLAVEEA